MLVIISDLHLNDGTTGATLSGGAFQVFVDRLREMAWRASWRADGRYRPIDRIDVILLGDVLDIIRSQRWLMTDARPWDDAHSPQLVETVTTIVDDILRRNQEAAYHLRSIAVDGAIAIPQASQTGEPIQAAELRPLSIRTHYMVGNHDWLLHLPGPDYDTIRQKVAHHLGLANPYNVPFPHDPADSDELLNVLRRHRVIARHGDIFDPINFTEDRTVSSIGDAIVIQLLGRFSLEIGRQLEGDLPANVMAGLRELDHIRPLLMAPVWIDGMLERACSRPVLRKEVKRIWDELADEFLELEIVRDRDSWSPFDLVDGLQQALKFSKRVSLGWASKISTWLLSLRGANSESYFQHALAEPDFRNRRARNIIYGHTHAAESLPLDASFADGYVLNQMFFNSGTWRRVYRPTVSAQGEHEFIPSETMTYLAFYNADERSGRPYESWSGSLGIGVGDAVTRRIDAGRNHAAEQSIPTSNVPVRAPHFRPTSNPSFAPVNRRSG